MKTQQAEIQEEEKDTMLFQQFQVDDGPFTTVKLDDKWFLTMGKYRLTEPMESREATEANARQITWHRIMQVVQIMIEENNQPKTK